MFLENTAKQYRTHKTKTEQYSIDPVYSNQVLLDPENDRTLRSKMGKGSTLFASIFLNQCLVNHL